MTTCATHTVERNKKRKFTQTVHSIEYTEYIELILFELIDIYSSCGFYIWQDILEWNKSMYSWSDNLEMDGNFYGYNADASILFLCFDNRQLFFYSLSFGKFMFVVFRLFFSFSLFFSNKCFQKCWQKIDTFDCIIFRLV